MLTDEQKAKRKKGIGASDSPIIMGYSNYKTPFQLYLEKTGLVSDEDDFNELQYWGNALEPVILAHFCEVNDVRATLPDTLYHPNYDFIFANLDGYIPSENAPVEVKNVNTFQRGEWDLASEDGIPAKYLIQLAKQVGLVNLNNGKCTHGYCAILIGGNEYKQFRYERDPALEEVIFQADIDFWDCIQNRIEPPSKIIADSKLKYKDALKDSSILTTFSIQESLQGLAASKEKQKALDKECDLYKMQIMEYMKTNEYLLGQQGEIIATWKATKKGNRVFNIK